MRRLVAKLGKTDRAPAMLISERTIVYTARHTCIMSGRKRLARRRKRGSIAAPLTVANHPRADSQIFGAPHAPHLRRRSSRDRCLRWKNDEPSPSESRTRLSC